MWSGVQGRNIIPLSLSDHDFKSPSYDNLSHIHINSCANGFVDRYDCARQAVRDARISEGASIGSSRRDIRASDIPLPRIFSRVHLEQTPTLAK